MPEQPSLTIKRRFADAAALLYAAWTRRDMLMHGFGPERFADEAAKQGHTYGGTQALAKFERTLQAA